MFETMIVKAFLVRVGNSKQRFPKRHFHALFHFFLFLSPAGLRSDAALMSRTQIATLNHDYLVILDHDYLVIRTFPSFSRHTICLFPFTVFVDEREAGEGERRRRAAAAY